MKKLISLFGLLLIISTTMFTSCAPEAEQPGKSDPVQPDPIDPVVTVKLSNSQVFAKGSVGELTENDDGSVSYTTSAQYSGGGYVFYIKEDKSVINLENYESISIDFDYEVVEGKWASEAPNPKWCLNLYKEGNDFYGGETIDYFASSSAKGTESYIYSVKDENKGEYNAICLKLNAYQSGNEDTDECKVTIKSIKLIRKANAGADKPSKPSEPAKEYPTDIFTVGEAGTCGIQIGDGELKPFEVYSKGSVATDIKVNDDGSVEWIASAAGGAGGGAALYLNGEDGTIDLANYESIDVEFVYSPITGSWNPKANNPGFAMRILPWDATGIFGGAEDLIYFEPENKDGYGTYKGTLKITEDFINKVVNSADFDAVKAFALKFNDYKRGNDDGDKVKVQLKKVKFNKKAGAPADKIFDDGLDEADYGTVQSIYYPTQDYTVLENAPKYEKHGWVYLPAGYDANDKDTKYPVFILLHGFGQNENSWGLSDQGNGGKIKGYMDRRMKSGEAEKFILVCVTGVASQNWGPNGKGQDFNGFNAFGGELRNNLLPYIRANYNVAEGRDNVALAGLSMGGGQTMTIGIGECLDLISYFGGFSPALFTKVDKYISSVDDSFPEYDIKHLYMICGDADDGISSFKEYGTYIKTNGWDKLGEKGKERFTYVEVPGGTHDFPVWYQGFKEYITYIFK